MTSPGFLGKRGALWVVLARWLVPVMMGAAYVVLAITSETDTTGKAWMTLGFAFVLVLWFLFRILTESAALSRAIAVGDADRALELADHQLGHRRTDAARAPLLVAKALAFEHRKDWAASLAALDEARPGAIKNAARASWEVMAVTARITALVETGRVGDARTQVDRELDPRVQTLDRRRAPTAWARVNLARGRLLLAEGDGPGGAAALQKVVDDVYAGDATRAQARELIRSCR